MLFNNRERYSNRLQHNSKVRWAVSSFKWMRLKWRRKEEQQAAATRLGLWSGLLVALVSVSFAVVGAWDIFEQQGYNLLHQARRELQGTPHWDSRVVVIAIDQKSTGALGRHPWPRDLYNYLLDRLVVSQPAVVAFDILFPETTQDDADLAAAIVENANVVLAVGDDLGEGYVDITDTIAEPAKGYFLRGDIGNKPDVDGISRRLLLHGKEADSLSVAALQVYAATMAATTQASITHAARLGQRNGAHDQKVSDANPLKHSILTKGTPAETHAVRQVTGLLLPPNGDEKSSSEGQILSPDRWVQQRIPKLNGSENLWISWPGEITSLEESAAASPGQLPVYSFIDVLRGNVDSSVFQNKIVLVGATLTGVDSVRTPFRESQVYGVHLHAAAINNLLNRSYLQQLPIWQSILLTIILAVAGSHWLRQLGAYQRLAVVACFPIGWIALAAGGFAAGWWLPVAAPIGTVVLSALAIQVHEQQEKQQLMELFSMNLSSETAELIWRHKGAILDEGELASQKLTATVLFMDIRGFTGIAEALPSHQLLPWLNQYFETMTDCIMEHGGMVDKYIGDSIMAVFGAPVRRTRPEEIRADAIAALDSAIEMHSRLTLLNQKLTEQQLPTIEFGIGIHTGSLIGGTVGNRHRLNYSLFGDTVNVAARLEAMTKDLPPKAAFKLLISADTYDCAKPDYPVELFKSTQLRGRESHTDVYTLGAATPAVATPPAPGESMLTALTARLSSTEVAQTELAQKSH